MLLPDLRLVNFHVAIGLLPHNATIVVCQDLKL
jgi:hypothetical protein